MKCEECGKKIILKVFPKFFQGRRYCSTNCYDRAKWKATHSSLEELQEIARRNGKRRVARNNLTKEVNLNKNGSL